MTYPELGAGVHKFELNFLEIPTARVDHERFANGDHTLLGTRNGSLEHQKVVLDDTVVGEATHGCDGLLGSIVFC